MPIESNEAKCLQGCMAIMTYMVAAMCTYDHEAMR